MIIIQLKTTYNLPDDFGIDEIGRKVLLKHHHFIDYEWKGPDLYVMQLLLICILLYIINKQNMFTCLYSKHLKAKAKNGKMLDILTIIYDKRGYKKRCNNSQEDWFRKYDGEFLAVSIHRVIEVKSI